jgi:hypothetical protein
MHRGGLGSGGVEENGTFTELKGYHANHSSSDGFFSTKQFFLSIPIN